MSSRSYATTHVSQMHRAQLAVFILAWSFITAQASRQTSPDSLLYNLEDARTDNPLAGDIEIQFGTSFPTRYAHLKCDEKLSRKSSNNLRGVLISKEVPADEWHIQAVNKQTGTVHTIRPEGLRSTLRKHLNIVYLRVSEADRKLLDTAKHKITILLRMANFPSIALGERATSWISKTYVPSKGKEDSDIYFSGNLVAGEGSRPVYSIDTKAAYLHYVDHAGSIGVAGAVIAEQGSDIDPDSIRTTARFEKVFVFPHEVGIILQSDFIGGEIDRKAKNSNLVSGVNGKLVLPSKAFGIGNYGTIDLVVGFEGGNNYKNLIVIDGIGAFWRWLAGADAYFSANSLGGFREITFAIEWRVRLPSKAEIFARGDELHLTTKPRHRVQASIDFMFSKALGMSLKSEYGSLPPAFNFIDKKISAGFVLKLAQEIN